MNTPNTKVHYMYLRDSQNMPKVTVAWYCSDNELFYNFAICNPKDHASKMMGRTIALGRVQKNPLVIPVILGENTHDTILHDLVHVVELMSKGSLSRTVAKLVRERIQSYQVREGMKELMKHPSMQPYDQAEPTPAALHPVIASGQQSETWALHSRVENFSLAPNTSAKAP